MSAPPPQGPPRREYPRAARPATAPPTAGQPPGGYPPGGSYPPAGAYPPAYRPQAFAPEPAVRGTLNAAYAPPPNTTGLIEQVWTPGQRTSNRLVFNVRSEERRVGKECRRRREADHAEHTQKEAKGTSAQHAR